MAEREPGDSALPNATTALASPADRCDPHAQLAALRAESADRHDPVRFRYLEALAQRALAQQGAVRVLLDDKLDKALRAYREHVAQHSPYATTPRDVATASPLADLLRHLAAHSMESIADADQQTNTRPELKTLRESRSAWAKLSVEKQVTQAIAQGPENAGPLNSHRLVLRALEAMRDISPDYLNRFMSYVDALLWLDQADKQEKAKSKATTKRSSAPRSTSRSRTR